MGEFWMEVMEEKINVFPDHIFNSKSSYMLYRYYCTTFRLSLDRLIVGFWVL